MHGSNTKSGRIRPLFVCGFRSISYARSIRQHRLHASNCARLRFLLHHVVVHDEAVADIGLDGFDGDEALAQVGANAQLVVLVHRQIHAVQVAFAAQRPVKRDHLRRVVLAAFLGQQVNLRNEVAARCRLLMPAGVADRFAVLVDDEPIFVGVFGHVALDGGQTLEVLDHVVGLVLPDNRRPVLVPDFRGQRGQLFLILLGGNGYERDSHGMPFRIR